MPDNCQGQFMKPRLIADSALAKFNELFGYEFAQRVSAILQSKFLQQTLVRRAHAPTVIRVKRLPFQQSVDRHGHSPDKPPSPRSGLTVPSTVRQRDTLGGFRGLTTAQAPKRHPPIRRAPEWGPGLFDAYATDSECRLARDGWQTVNYFCR